MCVCVFVYVYECVCVLSPPCSAKLSHVQEHILHPDTPELAQRETHRGWHSGCNRQAKLSQLSCWLPKAASPVAHVFPLR